MELVGIVAVLAGLAFLAALPLMALLLIAETRPRDLYRNTPRDH